VSAIADNENKLRCGELHENQTEDEKQTRTSKESLRLIYPELRKGGGKKEKRDDKVLRWLRLLTAKNKKSEASDKSGENNPLNVSGVFKAAKELIGRAATAEFSGSESTLHQVRGYQEIKH